MLKLLLYTIFSMLISSVLWSNDPSQYNKSEQLLQTPNQARAKGLETPSRSDNATRANSRSDDKTKAKERTSSRPTKRY